jgi:para-nitrobenzyl esterase
MPATKGLINKAIIESGSALKGVSRENTNKTAERLLAKLNLQPNQVDALQQLSTEKLLAAIDTRGQGAAGGGPFNFAPVVDGKNLPRDPWDPTAPDVSADVPVIIGSVNTEGTFFMPPDSPQFAPLYSLDEAGLKTQLTQRYGDAAEKLIEAYRKEAPDANPSKLFFMAMAFPGDAIKQAERKFAQGKAPAYMYLFTWETPVEGGRRHSPHTIELPFVFDNPQEQPDEVGNGPDLQPLADRVSGAWTAFARTGNPNTSLTPKWPAYNPDQRATMIINDEWKVVSDPRHEVRMIMQSLKGGTAS